MMRWAASFVIFALGAFNPISQPALAFQAPEVVSIAAGNFIFGSSQKQREYGYQLDEAAYGHSVTRNQGWYDSEARKAERCF